MNVELNLEESGWLCHLLMNEITRDVRNENPQVTERLKALHSRIADVNDELRRQAPISRSYPLLHLARRYGVDYGDVMLFSDYLSTERIDDTHVRAASRIQAQLSGVDAETMRRDIKALQSQGVVR